MGEPNNVLKAYMKKPERIRSILEYYIGRKLPQGWVVEEIGGFYTVKNREGKISFRERDILSRVRAGGSSFQLGLENQETVNLTYPWRAMELDCLAYREGIREIQERNGACGALYGAGDDFKYHYRKDDRLEPVLTLTLYWGRKEWEVPLSLGDMMDMAGLPVELHGKFADYRVNLIHMRAIPEEALQEMDSDLKYVLGLMKHTRSRKKYREYIWENRGYFSRIPRSAVDVIDVCTNIKDFRAYLQFKEDVENREETADMCKALVDIEKHAENRGIRKGRREGISEGISKGIREGIKGTVAILEGLGLSPQDILGKIQEQYNLSPETAKKYLQ